MRYIEGEISNRNTAMNMRTVMKLLWIWSVIVAAGFTLAAGQYASYGINQKRYPTPDGKGMICGDIDIRNEVRFFRQLENCTVIEGSLQILLIEGASQEQYQQLEFPDLVEITDYFLLYRVYGLKTLRHIFPNLSVIRGQNLFFNFALVAYEMMDLDELGLVGLASIERGAVRLEKNPLLCYVDTVDWTRIASGIAVSSDHFFKENRNPKECVKLCPPSCKETTIDNKKSRRCWTGEDCQRILTCDQQRCESGMCDKGICCDKNCLGGCTGPTGRDCVACKNVINVSNNQTICAKQCLPGTYEYRKRRCLHEDECIKTKNKLVKWNDPSKPGSCTAICPPGYQESSKDNRTCVQCENNRCPKSCPSKRVENVKTAQDLKECTIIDGHLEIRVKRGSNIGQELEANLGQIQEVKGHLWIHSSDALLSLNFFKSLRVIHGKDLANKRFALLINENVNLQELFREEVTNNLTIMNGNMIFHYNRKLCLHKIKDFENRVNMTSNKSDNDISETTNGDHMPCKVSQLNLTVVRVSARIAFLRWQNFKLPDARHLFGYVINYKEAPYKNVSIYDGRDACSDDIWSTRDVLNKSDKEEEYVSNLIVSLKPWTQYAVYIQTYTTSSAEYGAKSQIEYFKTAPAYPTVPVNLRVRAITNGSLYVSWDEPTHPNGNVTYYSVYWRRRPLVAEKLYERNYCHEPLFAQGEDNEIKKEERQKVQEKEKVKKNVTEEEGLCACPKTKEQQQEEETERMMQIEFENYLHNFVYIKRDRKTSGKKDLPGYQNFLRKLFRGRSPKGSLPNKDM